MRRPSLSPPPPPAPPRHAQQRRVIPEDRRAILVGLGIGAVIAGGALATWISLGAPL